MVIEMLIMSSNGMSIYNLEHIESIHVSHDGKLNIWANNYDGGAYMVDYQNAERAKQVLREIATNYATGQKIYTLPES